MTARCHASNMFEVVTQYSRAWFCFATFLMYVLPLNRKTITKPTNGKNNKRILHDLVEPTLDICFTSILSIE